MLETNTNPRGLLNLLTEMSCVEDKNTDTVCVRNVKGSGGEDLISRIGNSSTGDASDNLYPSSPTNPLSLSNLATCKVPFELVSCKSIFWSGLRV